MNTLIMKKQSRTLLILAMMILLLGGISFGASTKYIVQSVSPTATIHEGDDFTPTIVIKNNTGEEIKHMYLTINSSSYRPTSGVNTIQVLNNSSIANGNDFTINNIELEYLGGSEAFDFILTGVDDTDGDIAAETVTVLFNVKEDTSSSTTTNTANYKPVLTIDNTSIPKFESGQKVEIEIPVENESGHGAKDIVLTFTDGIDVLPFNVKSTDLTHTIDKISGKKEDTIVVEAVLSPLAASKVHELNVTLEYKNLYGDSFSKTDKIYLEIEKGEVEPILVYDQLVLQNNEEMMLGSEDILSVVFYNGGTLEAKDVKVVLDGFDDTGVVLNRDVDVKYAKDIRGGALGYVNYKVKTGSSPKSGDFELTGKVTYADLSGNEYEKEFSFTVPVVGKDTDQIDVAFSGLTVPNGVKAGDTFKVIGKVVNNGSVTIDSMDVKLNFSPELVAKSRKTLTFSNLKAGESEDVSFTLMLKPDSQSEYFGIDVVAEYFAEGDSEDDMETVSDYVGFDVNSESKVGRPKLIVEGYSYGSEAALAGNIITMEMEIKNTSKVESVKNIKVTMSDTEGVFTPVNSSNSFFVEAIPAGQTVVSTMDFKVKSDAQVKNYQMSVKMEYEDSQGNAYDEQDQPFAETEQLSINVAQPIRLEMGEVNLPFELAVGQPFNLEMDFYNMGKSTMYNMMIKMEGNFMVQDANYFVGNFDTGRSDYYSGVLIPEAEGPVEGKILFTFEDALGNVIEQEKTFSVNAMTMEFPSGEDFYPPEGDFPGMDGFEEEKPGLPWYAYAIGVVVLVVFIVVFMRRRKKKKEALLMEDDDE